MILELNQSIMSIDTRKVDDIKMCDYYRYESTKASGCLPRYNIICLTQNLYYNKKINFS